MSVKCIFKRKSATEWLKESARADGPANKGRHGNEVYMQSMLNQYKQASRQGMLPVSLQHIKNI